MINIVLERGYPVGPMRGRGIGGVEGVLARTWLLKIKVSRLKLGRYPKP